MIGSYRHLFCRDVWSRTEVGAWTRDGCWTNWARAHSVRTEVSFLCVTTSFSVFLEFWKIKRRFCMWSAICALNLDMFAWFCMFGRLMEVWSNYYFMISAKCLVPDSKEFWFPCSNFTLLVCYMWFYWKLLRLYVLVWRFSNSLSFWDLWSAN